MHYKTAFDNVFIHGLMHYKAGFSSVFIHGLMHYKTTFDNVFSTRFNALYSTVNNGIDICNRRLL